MRYIYCPVCGEKLTKTHAGDDGEVPYCETCDKRWFDSFSDCVIVLVYNEYNEIVLLRQAYLSDKYATFISGYIVPGENAEESAKREVKEETDLELESLEYAGTYWFGKGNMLMHGFLGFTHKKEMTLSEEVDSAEWIPLKNVVEMIFPDEPGNAAYGIYKKFKTKIQTV